MPGPQEQTCTACDGEGITTKVAYTVETDTDGRQNPVTHTSYSSCTLCGGTGSTSG